VDDDWAIRMMDLDGDSFGGRRRWRTVDRATHVAEAPQAEERRRRVRHGPCGARKRFGFQSGGMPANGGGGASENGDAAGPAMAASCRAARCGGNPPVEKGLDVRHTTDLPNLLADT
jgi:hypothetical protein